ncbi:Ribonuclease-like protein [Camelus dromedarius]|uniref:Ribonuclease-like protein n=2 Tax=Camelus TaxID=9836 RepID=A0A5N4E495_CAMDR|nr:ribonuclease homolog [Camelus dromedarius]KAB1278202.1 Ribonuclease-like protein [Camelus dromedarius]
MDQLGFSEPQDLLHHQLDRPKTKISAKHKYYCDVMMKVRGLATDKSCKKTKTFVHSVSPNTGGLCEGPAVRCVKMSDFYNCHLIIFKVTQCNLYPDAVPPHCYYKGITLWRDVSVVCVGKHPIHLNE